MKSGSAWVPMSPSGLPLEHKRPQKDLNKAHLDPPREPQERPKGRKDAPKEGQWGPGRHQEGPGFPFTSLF